MTYSTRTGQAGEAAVDRAKVNGGSARSHLLTTLGEFAWPDGKPAWTSSLLYVLSGLGFDAQAARRAVTRASSAGWITGERRGRETVWTVTPKGNAIIADGFRRVRSLSQPPPTWDGRWLSVLMSVPDSQRIARSKLRKGLSWAGLGTPMTGVWVTPHADREAEVRRLVIQMGLEENTISFLGPSTSLGVSDDELVRRAWDLDAIRAGYEELVRQYMNWALREDEDVLVAHIRVVNRWAQLPFEDPVLPEELAPNWVGRRVASMLQGLGSQWQDMARQRWQEINRSGGNDRGTR
ncbi:MAG: hypothetical protein ABS81_00910 [Pseudonocardia sp. SCN 72-86]|nr:MAG: hypothetical protein ABS81_00910 [Pseudonocardia sp. SCN 72-86]